VRSDAYELSPEWTLRLAAERIPVVDLDSDHFKMLADFEERFAQGPPSLVECRRLTVNGDVRFGRDVVVRGEVTVDGPARIEDDTVLEG
jgi:UTP--glucose-1-phosphate uridylyltransferase